MEEFNFDARHPYNEIRWVSDLLLIVSVTYVNIFAVAISEWFAGIVGIDVTITIFQFSKPNHYTQCSLYHIHHNYCQQNKM